MSFTAVKLLPVNWKESFSMMNLTRIKWNKESKIYLDECESRRSLNQTNESHSQKKTSR